MFPGAKNEVQNRSGRDPLPRIRRGLALQPKRGASVRQLTSARRRRCQGAAGMAGGPRALSLCLRPVVPPARRVPAPHRASRPPLRQDLLRQRLGPQVLPAGRDRLSLLARGPPRAC